MSDTTSETTTSAVSPEEIALSVPDFDPEVSEEIEAPSMEPDQDNKDAKNPSPESAKDELAKAQSLIKKLKLKVDGQEFEEEIDLSNEEQLIRDIQLARAAKKRMAEAQEAKRKAFELVQAFDTDPTSLLKRHPKGYELAEQLLLEKIQAEMMTPEQRQMMQMQKELEAYKAQEKAIKEQQEQAQLQALEAKQAEHYQKTIIDALEKAGLPKTPEAAKRMAFLLHKNLELGLELDAVELAQEAKKEYQMTLQSLAKNATPEQLLQILDQETLKKLRQYDAQQYKAKQKMTGFKTPSQSHAVPPSPQRERPQTLEEWQEELNQRMRKK